MADMLERIGRLVQTTPPEIVAKLGTLQREREQEAEACNPVMLYEGLRTMAFYEGWRD